MNLTHITRAALAATTAEDALKAAIVEAVAAGATVTAVSDAAGGVARTTLYRWIRDVESGVQSSSSSPRKRG